MDGSLYYFHSSYVPCYRVSQIQGLHARLPSTDRTQICNLKLSCIRINGEMLGK